MKTNKSLRIGIVDDERPARAGLRFEVEDASPESEIFEADSGAAALELLNREPLDLLFLDINLGDMKSTVLVPAIQKLRPDMMICFVTAYSDFAVEAFRLEIDDYIMKPPDPERIGRVLSRAAERREKEDSSEPDRVAEASSNAAQRFGISSRNRTVYVDVSRIVYAETSDRGCNIYTDSQVYYDTRSIGLVEKRLPAFVRVHKSFLVNPAKVREVFPWGKNTWCLKMDGYEDNILPVARDKIHPLRELLEK